MTVSIEHLDNLSLYAYNRAMNTNAKIIVTIVVVALLGVIGYLVLNKNGSMTPTTVTPTTAMAEPTAAPTAEVSPSPVATGAAMMKEDTMTVALAAQNNSGETGTATLKEVAGKTTVSIKLTDAPATAQPAHIHVGSCPTPGAIAYNLDSVVNGKSETTLNVTLKDLKAKEPLAINVHNSATDIKTYVACGNLK